MAAGPWEESYPVVAAGPFVCSCLVVAADPLAVVEVDLVVVALVASYRVAEAASREAEVALAVAADGATWDSPCPLVAVASEAAVKEPMGDAVACSMVALAASADVEPMEAAADPGAGAEEVALVKPVAAAIPFAGVLAVALVDTNSVIAAVASVAAAAAGYCCRRSQLPTSEPCDRLELALVRRHLLW